MGVMGWIAIVVLCIVIAMALGVIGLMYITYRNLGKVMDGVIMMIDGEGLERED